MPFRISHLFILGKKFLSQHRKPIRMESHSRTADTNREKIFIVLSWIYIHGHSGVGEAEAEPALMANQRKTRKAKLINPESSVSFLEYQNLVSNSRERYKSCIKLDCFLRGQHTHTVKVTSAMQGHLILEIP